MSSSLGRVAEAKIADQPPVAGGTSRIAAIAAGSRIDTQPMPIPSARAASHSVWTAMTAENSAVSGIVSRPSPAPWLRRRVAENGEVARRGVEPGEL